MAIERMHTDPWLERERRRLPTWRRSKINVVFLATIPHWISFDIFSQITHNHRYDVRIDIFFFIEHIYLVSREC